MKYEYDKEVDGLYIWFVDDVDGEKEDYEQEIWPIELKNEIGLLFSKRGKLFGLEIMPASKYFEQKQLDDMI
ncbi:DUF2283 domain-containing protein [Polluticaenibacter yanchengensis]|uniref:DUF2283 domain-containing protein n=1 Tax=Polluticaenibacter yanchengensis TaxID=3014562 RepID=A0ABT4URP7_9BACT|nr:DUF2283 domain-containing protein [Chitinophagaceae bacterium LY-5]